MEKFVHEKKHFNANLIQKYFKDQPPTSDLKTKYTDSFFPPTPDSILSRKPGEVIEGSNGNSSINIENVHFRRIDEIQSGYEVFQDQIEFSDINQRGLGHCYFMCAIAALAENPIMISRLFRTKKKNEAGYYELVLFIDGEWQVVIVDDFFVVHNNFEYYTNPFVFSSPNGKEMWVLILEKAWAKVNGGFTNIISGNPKDAMLALTGFNSEAIFYNSTKIDEIWEKLLDAYQHNYFIASSTTQEIESLREQTGIVESHAFSMVAVIEGEFDGELLRLVKIRNPWGYEEWKGDYSDYDEVNWTEQKSKFFGFERNNKDGIFFMKIEDHVKLFNNSCICRMFYNPFVFNYNIPRSEIEQPHVFNLIVDQEETHLNVSVMFWHWRFNREFALDKQKTEHPTSLVIAKYDEDFNLSETCGKFNSIGNLDYNVKLTKGRYVVWVYCNYESSSEPKHSTYYVRFLSEKQFYVRKSEHFDKFFALIKKMIIAGLNELYQSEIENYEKNEWNYIRPENDFKETGLGYLFIKKHPKASHVCVEYDMSQIQGLSLLPPKKVEVKGQIYTDNEEVIIGLMNGAYEIIWMNVDYSIKAFYEPESVITGMKRDVKKFMSQEKIENLKLHAKADPQGPNKSIEEKNKIIVKQKSVKESKNLKKEETPVPFKVSKHERLIEPIEKFFVNPRGEVILNYSKIKLCHMKTGKFLIVPTEEVSEDTINAEVCVGDVEKDKEDDSLFTIIHYSYSGDDKIRNKDSINLCLDKINRFLFLDIEKRSKISRQIEVHFDNFIPDDPGLLFKIQFIYSPYGDNILRIGSVFKLLNQKFALHSHLEFLPGTENKLQEVTGFGGSDENDYWTIVECL